MLNTSLFKLICPKNCGQQYKKADLLCAFYNNSHSVTSVTLAVTSVTLKFT